jgi:hypothetical protein
MRKQVLDDLLARLGGEQLRHPGLEVGALAGVLHARGLEREEPRASTFVAMSASLKWIASPSTSSPIPELTPRTGANPFWPNEPDGGRREPFRGTVIPYVDTLFQAAVREVLTLRGVSQVEAFTSNEGGRPVPVDLAPLLRRGLISPLRLPACFRASRERSVRRSEWTTNGSATWRDPLPPVHRYDVGACALPIGRSSSTVAVATRQYRHSRGAKPYCRFLFERLGPVNPFRLPSRNAHFSFGALWRTISDRSCPGFSIRVRAVRRPESRGSWPGQDLFGGGAV